MGCGASVHDCLRIPLLFALSDHRVLQHLLSDRRCAPGHCEVILVEVDVKGLFDDVRDIKTGRCRRAIVGRLNLHAKSAVSKHGAHW